MVRCRNNVAYVTTEENDSANCRLHSKSNHAQKVTNPPKFCQQMNKPKKNIYASEDLSNFILCKLIYLII